MLVVWFILLLIRNYPEFDPQTQSTVYIGQGVSGGRMCVKEYSVNVRNKGHEDLIIYSTDVPTFPRSEGEEERGYRLCLEKYSCLENNN